MRRQEGISRFLHHSVVFQNALEIASGGTVFLVRIQVPPCTSAIAILASKTLNATFRDPLRKPCSLSSCLRSVGSVCCSTLQNSITWAGGKLKRRWGGFRPGGSPYTRSETRTYHGWACQILAAPSPVTLLMSNAPSLVVPMASTMHFWRTPGLGFYYSNHFIQLYTRKVVMNCSSHLFHGGVDICLLWTQPEQTDRTNVCTISWTWNVLH